ncbi:MAG: acyltransferase [Flavobacterium sp.]|uniref:acyltransferase family protein n=1 Tax=Flavobacterium sp. TaxID=239 RepID=UPI00120EA6B7|nr:acyltransferase [Flavobacterium sp.]RZJ68437.1 MAG: acyltransferase [Flavobacterium sp.]
MSTTLQPKKHFQILDGLRGVAAVTVVIFHLFEAHATSHLDQIVNHGYLAVDFFYLLSGFVIGYAYDDRWEKMTLKDFFKRRLIRLQPMVIMGMIVGACLFYFSTSPILFPKIPDVPVWQVIGIMLIGFTLLPIPTPMDIRGWGEMHPLNGPGWSLFYEYIANILYAIGVRKFNKTALTILVVVCGVLLIHYAVTSAGGDVIGGWSLTWESARIGFTRMLYPFFAGLLLFRVSKLSNVKNAFVWCSLLVVAVLAFPRIGGKDQLWMNGLYDSLSIVFIFPLIVYVGASGEVSSRIGSKVCKFLGDISYPIYITHYPLIYVYTAWVFDSKPTADEALPMAALTFVTIIALGYASLKVYDEPVRKWISKKLN